MKKKENTLQEVKEEQINEILVSVLDLFQSIKDDFPEVAISISATFGDSIARKRYVKDGKSGMILEHVMSHELARIQEDNQSIYS